MPMFMHYQKYEDKDTTPQEQEELQRFLHVQYCWNFTVLQGIDSAHTVPCTLTHIIYFDTLCVHISKLINE